MLVHARCDDAPPSPAPALASAGTATYNWFSMTSSCTSTVTHVIDGCAAIGNALAGSCMSIRSVVKRSYEVEPALFLAPRCGVGAHLMVLFCELLFLALYSVLRA